MAFFECAVSSTTTITLFPYIVKPSVWLRLASQSPPEPIVLFLAPHLFGVDFLASFALIAVYWAFSYNPLPHFFRVEVHSCYWLNTEKKNREQSRPRNICSYYYKMCLLSNKKLLIVRFVIYIYIYMFYSIIYIKNYIL